MDRMMPVTLKRYVIMTIGTFFFSIILPEQSIGMSGQELSQLLIDISGWTANTPKVETISTTNMNMVTIKKTYLQGGNKTFHAMIVTGNTTPYQSGFASGVNIDTPASRVTAQTINGFQVVSQYQKAGKSGAVMVMIKGGQVRGAIFILEFRGITDREALDLSKKFDWNEMKVKTT